MIYLSFCLGMCVGIIMSIWVLWGMYQKEKRELQVMMRVALGYSQLKNLMEKGREK